MILVTSLTVLAIASNYVVENAMRIAGFFKIGEMATGFILLSVSTSLPELSIGIISSREGEGAVSIGNVLGSNIADVLLVIGLMAIATGFTIKRDDAREFIRILFMTSIIPLGLLLVNRLGSAEGAILIIIFVCYSYYLVKKEVSLEFRERISRKKFRTAVIIFTAGVAAVIVSADVAVNFAVGIATDVHISEAYIGATVVALGTSLPELAVDLSAVRKGNVRLALGDALGSCMTNLTLILGFTGLLSPMTYSMLAYSGFVLFLLLANMTLWYFFDTGRRLGRIEGIVLVLIYSAFILAELVIS